MFVKRFPSEVSSRTRVNFVYYALHDHDLREIVLPCTFVCELNIDQLSVVTLSHFRR